MRKTQPSLNALRAFEAAARHLSFTKAGVELRVSQAAVSYQVKTLEELLGVRLFHRVTRGLALTDEGQALAPVLIECFARMAGILERFEDGHYREVVTVGAVGTFAVGWLLPRLRAFSESHPFVDLRLLTNNNRIDMAGEGLDFAIRFGDGSWTGTDAVCLFSAPLAPLCAPETAVRLKQPKDLTREVLLRSYRVDEWTRWFAAAGLPCPLLKGPVFDSSLALAEAAAQGAGVALLPARLFAHDLRRRRLVRPFDLAVDVGAYWLTWLRSKPLTGAMHAFKQWLMEASAADRDRPAPTAKPSAKRRTPRAAAPRT